MSLEYYTLLSSYLLSICSRKFLVAILPKCTSFSQIHLWYVTSQLDTDMGLQAMLMGELQSLCEAATGWNQCAGRYSLHEATTGWNQYKKRYILCVIRWVDGIGRVWLLLCFAFPLWQTAQLRLFLMGRARLPHSPHPLPWNFLQPKDQQVQFCTQHKNRWFWSLHFLSPLNVKNYMGMRSWQGTLFKNALNSVKGFYSMPPILIQPRRLIPLKLVCFWPFLKLPVCVCKWMVLF